MKVNWFNLVIAFVLCTIVGTILSALGADFLPKVVCGVLIAIAFPWLEAKEKDEKDGKTN